MYFLLLTFNLMMTLTFLFLNHPMSMGLILMLQTIIISLITGLFSYTFWFSYILFLVMIGGMLILFIYMTSLASNEMFNFSKKILFFNVNLLLLFTLIYMFMDHMPINILFKNSNLMDWSNNIMMLKNENLYSLNNIYNNPNFYITIMLINYLFLTLMAVVKITNMNYGPLRQKF
uniref:NADH-ubiquinone oxidoreductase chain 6 n=1 Tax=Eretes sticticus TaxID=107803 RepID=A0A7S8CV15_EREST|nr:NADH dehydrogenase subunit 6 [Eretes sticticus]QPC56732.1 NADH dehydrogenase subunit 6 [Eretes sticticus]